MLGLQPTGELTAQVGWLGLKVGSRLAQPCIRQMNRVYGALESVVCACYSATEIVVVIIIIIIIAVVIIVVGDGEASNIHLRVHPINVILEP